MAADAEFQYPAGIVSAVTLPEAHLLHALARGKHVLELGAQFGCSTIVMAQSARHVVSVDWHRGDHQAGRIDSLPIYWTNLKHWKVDHKVTIVVDRFDQALSIMRPNHFDFVFVDGCHDEEAVQADIELVMPLVRPGGMVAFHDYARPEFPGVTRQVNKFADRHLSNVNVTGHVGVVNCQKR